MQKMKIAVTGQAESCPESINSESMPFVPNPRSGCRFPAKL